MATSLPPSKKHKESSFPTSFEAAHDNFADVCYEHIEQMHDAFSNVHGTMDTIVKERSVRYRQIANAFLKIYDTLRTHAEDMKAIKEENKLLKKELVDLKASLGCSGALKDVLDDIEGLKKSNENVQDLVNESFESSIKSFEEDTLPERMDAFFKERMSQYELQLRKVLEGHLHACTDAIFEKAEMNSEE